MKSFSVFEILGLKKKNICYLRRLLLYLFLTPALAVRSFFVQGGGHYSCCSFCLFFWYEKGQMEKVDVLE